MNETAIVQWALNALFGVVMLLLGWILNNVSKGMDRLDKDVRAMPEKYVLKTDFVQSLRDIHETLQRIEDKIDKKMDKGMVK